MSRWRRPRLVNRIVEDEDDGGEVTETTERRPNTSRRSRRTDFGRRRCEFRGGRSIPVVRQAIGHPEIYRFSLGQSITFGAAEKRAPLYVIGIDYGRGTLTVPL